MKLFVVLMMLAGTVNAMSLQDHIDSMPTNDQRYSCQKYAAGQMNRSWAIRRIAQIGQSTEALIPCLNHADNGYIGDMLKFTHIHNPDVNIDIDVSGAGNGWYAASERSNSRDYVYFMHKDSSNNHVHFALRFRLNNVWTSIFKEHNSTFDGVVLKNVAVEFEVGGQARWFYPYRDVAIANNTDLFTGEEIASLVTKLKSEAGYSYDTPVLTLATSISASLGSDGSWTITYTD